MVLNDEVREVIENSAFLTLITLDAEGNPHPIIAGKGEIAGDDVVFGIYKMKKTQQNLLKNKSAWVLGAFKEKPPKGFRLKGTARAEGKQLIFTPLNAEALL
jgi:predicted pyridoxine 5'-phosphate oxidase superfamily flavin-nucleotide-binding protein